jgi:hypothetical protein
MQAQFKEVRRISAQLDEVHGNDDDHTHAIPTGSREDQTAGASPDRGGLQSLQDAKELIREYGDFALETGPIAADELYRGVRVVRVELPVQERIGQHRDGRSPPASTQLIHPKQVFSCNLDSYLPIVSDQMW